jgi:hypothetical protein
MPEAAHEYVTAMIDTISLITVVRPCTYTSSF